MGISKNKLVGLAAATAMSMGVGCENFDDARKYSDNTDCGEFGEFLLDEGFERREYQFKLDEPPTWEDHRSARVVKQTRDLIKACELGAKMNDKSLKESAKYFAKVVAVPGEEKKSVNIADHVAERTKWAVSRGLVESCSEIAISVDLDKYKGASKSPNQVKEDFVSMMEYSCTAIFYNAKDYAERN